MSLELSKGPNESRVAKIWKEGGGISSDDETILQRRREENDWVFGKRGASVLDEKIEGINVEHKDEDMTA